jgi:hypothetical protein
MTSIDLIKYVDSYNHYFITSMIVAVIVGSYNHFSITSIVVIAVIVGTIDVIKK